MKKYILKAWHGEESLKKVFWIYSILGLLLFSFLLNFLQLVGVSAEENGHSTNGLLSLMVALTIGFIVYMIWALGSLWKCSFNVKWKWWGYLSRLYILWFVLAFGSSIVAIIFKILSN